MHIKREQSSLLNRSTQRAQQNKSLSLKPHTTLPSGSKLPNLPTHSPAMTNLLTGGTGKTSKRLADLLLGAKIPFLLASRKAESSAPSGMPAARFDWLDSETFEIPFKHPSLTNEKGSGISAVYLIAPEIPDPVLPMQAFIDLAVHRYGVKRFVMLTGSSVEKGGVNVGPVWEYLSKMEGVKYHVLRATWFMGAD